MLLQCKGYNLLIRLTIIKKIDIDSHIYCLIVIFLKYWNKNVAATNVIANPTSNDDMRLNGLAPSVRTDVN